MGPSDNPQFPMSENPDSPHARATTVLQQRLGDCVSTEPGDLHAHSYDGMKIAFSADAVVRPAQERDVGVLLELANVFEVPVTTRGAGSTLTGSAAPKHGGWVLDLAGLDAFEIDPLTNFCHAQAGAVVGRIQEAAREQGRFYPPDPSSLKWCTIGGNIACNAGGLRCVKYGVTRDYVVSVAGFLPTGESVQFGRDLKKFASGYNLRDLWIGSEGMLGVITHATLKLIPAPRASRTFLAAFSTERAVLESVQELLVAGKVQPSILEFLDRLSLQGAEGRIGRTLFPGSPGSPVLLVEVDGHPAQVAEDAEHVKQWLSRSSIDFIEAASQTEADQLWEVRRKCSGAMFELGNSKLNQDVVVPIRKEADLVEYVETVRAETGLPIAVFGHAGDGNLHVNVMYDRRSVEVRERAARAVKMVMEKVVALGGSISGEHGIGLAKTAYTGLEFSAAEFAAMKSVKKALDPRNILNPGKLFERFEPWRHDPVEVQLPWDHAKASGAVGN